MERSLHREIESPKLGRGKGVGRAIAMGLAGAGARAIGNDVGSVQQTPQRRRPRS